MSVAAAPRRRFPLLAVVVVVALVLAALAYAGFFGGGADPAGAWRSTPVERGDVRVLISATGTLRATTTVDVGSQVSGQVLEVLVDFNDKVAAGQPIARLDPAPLQTRLQQAEADLASARALVNEAQATAKNAEADYMRKSDLLERQLIARSDADLALATRDQARARVISAQAAVQQRQAAVDNARLDVDYTVIRAPVDGVVLLRQVEPGQTVAASFQTPVLFQIAEDLAQMQIDLSIDEADVGQIHEGLAVSFTVDAFPDRQFQGTVRQVRLAATASSSVVSYPVVVQVQNADFSLLPGMTASAEIVVSQRDDVLRVANAALRFTPPDADAAAGASRGSLLQDLPRVAADLHLDPTQQAAFDAALAQVRERISARTAAPAATTATMGAGGGFRGPGGGPGGSAGSSGGPSQEAMRARMAEAMTRTFADFRAALDPQQQATWDSELRALATARRGTVWKLVDGVPQPVVVRLGASDGTVTEIAGDIAEGDAVLTGQEAPGRMNSDDPVIRLRGLGKVYSPGTAAEVVALRGVDLDVARGEFLAIMGPSGSGKSTLMNLVGCLDTASSGTYHCDGVDVATLDAAGRAQLRLRKIGFVFQGFNLLSRQTALENVAMPLSYADVPVSERLPRARAALAEVGLEDRAGHRPSELSGGQQQRVAIARALINQPPLLLADEPTGALDSRTGEEILALFQRLKRSGRTIVLITHDRHVADHADRIVVMHDGQMHADGWSPTEAAA